MVLLTALIQGMLSFWIKDTAHRGIVSTICVLVVLLYAIISQTISSIPLLNLITPFHGVPILVLVLAVVLIWRTLRATVEIKTFKFLNMLAVLLIAVSLAQAAFGFAETSRALTVQQVPVLSTASQPDIYFLMFDEYTGPRALNDLYGFDDSSFTQALADKGFYVASNSTSNYFGSLHSIDSIFNLNYLKSFTNIATSKSYDPVLLESLIQKNAVVSALKNSGYKFYQVGSWWNPTRSNIEATTNFQAQPDLLNLPLFADHFLVDNTILQPVMNQLYPVSQDTSTVPNQVESVTNLAGQNFGPKFVFAHILLPHAPNVYGANCQDVSGKGYADNNQEAYLNQVRCANKTILAMVEQIQKKSATPPIIIVQSDEGNELKYDAPSSVDAVPQSFEEKYSILNAFYFPDKNYSLLYPTITSVNTFRVVFQQYFGANLPVLPDNNRLLTGVYDINTAKDVTTIVQNSLGFVAK